MSRVPLAPEWYGVLNFLHLAEECILDEDMDSLRMAIEETRRPIEEAVEFLSEGGRGAFLVTPAKHGPVDGEACDCCDGWVTGPELNLLYRADAPYTSVVPCPSCELGLHHRRRGEEQGYLWLEAVA